jgi:hypothetical protein
MPHHGLKIYHILIFENIYYVSMKMAVKITFECSRPYMTIYNSTLVIDFDIDVIFYLYYVSYQLYRVRFVNGKSRPHNWKSIFHFFGRFRCLIHSLGIALAFLSSSVRATVRQKFDAQDRPKFKAFCAIS